MKVLRLPNTWVKLNRPAVSHTLVKDNFLSFLSQANKCNVIPLKNFFVWRQWTQALKRVSTTQTTFFLLTMMFLLQKRMKEWESVMSDGPRSHRIPLNGGAIKVITLQTIKKGHESPGQLRLLPRFQSWAVFSLPPLCPGRSIWLGTHFRSCRRRSSRRRGCHQTWFARRKRLATTSHNGTRHRLLRRKEGGRSDSFSDGKQSYCRCMRPRSGTHWCQSDTSALHLWCTDHLLSHTPHVSGPVHGLCTPAATLSFYVLLGSPVHVRLQGKSKFSAPATFCLRSTNGLQAGAHTDLLYPFVCPWQHKSVL